MNKVIDLAAHRAKVEGQITIEERLARVNASLARINRLLKELEELIERED